MKAILPGIEGDLSTPLLGSKSTVQDLTTEALFDITVHAHDTDNSTDKQLLDKGYLEYGCTHLRRMYRIRAPCCNEIFACVRCHDESKNNLDKDGHKILQKQIRQIICSLCNTEQEFQQICINCGVCMGRYFCEICKVLKDDTSNKIWHCHSCGVCRRSRQEDQIIHCNKCQCCLEKTHICIEGLLHRNCHICFKYLLETTDAVSAAPCGHVIHDRCFPELKKFPNTCPICFKTFADMSGRNTTWRLQLYRFLHIFKTNWFLKQCLSLDQFHLSHLYMGHCLGQIFVSVDCENIYRGNFMRFGSFAMI